MVAGVFIHRSYQRISGRCSRTNEISGGGHETRGVQPRRPAAVRCSVWLGEVASHLRDIRLCKIPARFLVYVGNLYAIVLLTVLDHKRVHLLAALNAEWCRVQHSSVRNEGDSQTRQHASSADRTAQVGTKRACAIQKIAEQQTSNAEKNTPEKSWQELAVESACRVDVECQP